jgi:dihydrofolate reductase
MRKIIVTEYVSLDGVMEDPAWTAPYWNDEIAKFKYDELFASDLLLLGRVTYDGMSAAWPTMDEGEFGEKMNAMQKLVASRSLKRADWNATVIQGSLEAEAAKLRKGSGQDILVAGSSMVVSTLMSNKLVDEYRFLTYPIVVGKGKRLLPEQMTVPLKLIESKSFSSGVVLLRYVPDKE